MEREWDVVIIGGGVAGLSAAQMVGRSRRRTLVLDAGAPRNRFATHLHGVLGHDGTDPAQLLEACRTEARAYEVEFAGAAVAHLADEDDHIQVVRADGEVERARAVIIASGASDDLPDVRGLQERWGRSVLHCPYCHGWEVAGRPLGVLAVSPLSSHQVQLVRQLSDDVTAFTAAAEPLGEDIRTRFAAREVRIVPEPVVEVRDAAGDGLIVVTSAGEEHRVHALFTGGAPVIDLGFAADLALERADAPGASLVVDAMGTTSHPRVFAAGNVVSPFGNIPVSMSAGSMAGAGANAALVAEDFADAIAERTARRNADWEQRYAERDHFWSGGVNATVAALVSDLEPGTALDVGSGEGGDVVWLAEQGWRATGVDVSATAIARATRLAETRRVEVELRIGDGASAVEGEFDLVSASFLHSWEPDFPRIRLLREAASRVAPGGRLLVVSHAGSPPWAHEMAAHAPLLRGPEDELALLELDRQTWRPEVVELRSREVTAPDGTAARIDDSVLLLRRLP